MEAVEQACEHVGGDWLGQVQVNAGVARVRLRIVVAEAGDLVAAFLLRAFEHRFAAEVAREIAIAADLEAACAHAVDVEMQFGAVGGIQGADSVAAQFAGRARGAQPALVDGVPGAAWAPRGALRVAFQFTISDHKIVAIDILADPERLRNVTLVDG